MASSVVAAALSVSIIFAADLLLANFTARIDNYALGIGIPLGVAPLLLYPLVHINYRMERVKADLERMVRTDALTGLANRRAFFEAAERLFADTGGADQPVAVMMADIDHFKNINDCYGHAAGDDVLRHVADVISGAVADAAAPGKSLVARIGGEEFAILFTVLDAAGAAAVADRICDAVRRSSLPRNGFSCAATISVGVALRVASGSLDDIMSAADRAAYEAKRFGRDRWVMSGSSTQAFADPSLPVAGAAQAA